MPLTDRYGSLAQPYRPGRVTNWSCGALAGAPEVIYLSIITVTDHRDYPLTEPRKRKGGLPPDIEPLSVWDPLH
jgi:hypothetical protein